MAEEREGVQSKPGDPETQHDDGDHEQDAAEKPGLFGGRLAPIGVRALALAGFVTLVAGGPLDSRHSVTGP